MDNIQIVLVEPRIPHNTGAIGRLCAASNSVLHLIHPLGFRLCAKEIKRSGMDYWSYLDIKEWVSLDVFWAYNPPTKQHFFLTTKSCNIYHKAHFSAQSFLYFGREDKGLPDSVLQKFKEQCLSIPMNIQARSLNLATAVAIVLYEAIRQSSVNEQ